MARSPEIDQGDRRYISTVMDAPVLEKEYEFELARRWRDGRDEDALHELITAYARFVVRIAWGFRGYGRQLTLRGRVPTFQLKQMLETLLRDVAHVEMVVNEVDVISSTGLSTTQPK